MTTITVNATAIKNFAAHGTREPVFDVASSLGAPRAAMMEAVIDGPLRMHQRMPDEAGHGDLVYLSTDAPVQEIDTRRLPVLQRPVIIHVNRQNIAMNRKDGRSRPCFTAKFPGQNARYSNFLRLSGPCRLVFNGNQLPCGAWAWVETDGHVELSEPMTFRESRQVA